MSLVKCECGIIMEYHKTKYCQTCTIIDLKQENEKLKEQLKDANKKNDINYSLRCELEKQLKDANEVIDHFSDKEWKTNGEHHWKIEEYLTKYKV